MVGGVVGNQIGDGTGQTVATVAGTAANGYQVCYRLGDLEGTVGRRFPVENGELVLTSLVDRQ